MKTQYIEARNRRGAGRPGRTWIFAVLLGFATVFAAAQSPQAPPAPAPPVKPPDSAQDSDQDSGQAPSKKPETHITPDQAKELFALVDQLIQFSSQETGLEIKSSVKR